MYSKIRTLTDEITLAKTRIELPRDAVIDQIFIKFTAKIKNNGAAEWSGKLENILKAIEEIRVVSDGSTVHYALSAVDVAILNKFNSPNGFAPDLAETITLAADAEVDKSFVLKLDEGDILAAAKDNLEMKVIMGTIATDISFVSLMGEVSIVENVLSPEEMLQNYGGALEFAAEPKVYALSEKINVSTDLQSALDLPTGSLHRAAVLCFVGDNGLVGGADPGKIGLINTSPDRREVLNVDWETLRAFNASEHDLNGAGPAGVVLVNYAKDVTADGFGLRAWRFTKGDWQIAAKSANAATMRYICLEHVTNTAVFDAQERAQLELTD